MEDKTYTEAQKERVQEGIKVLDEKALNAFNNKIRQKLNKKRKNRNAAKNRKSCKRK